MRILGRWFLIGLALWTLGALLLASILPWRVAPAYRELRNQAVSVVSKITGDEAETADLAPITHTGGNLFGINTFLFQEVDEEKIRRSLQMIKDAGFGYVREQIPWQELERGGKGNYWDERWNRPTWDHLDQLVDLINEYDLELIARLDYPPDWALPPGTTWHATPPANYEDFGDFVYAVVSRYKGKIKYYQIWNEPNLTIEWGLQPVNAADYVRLLKIAYTRAKEADPNVVIIAAALAPTIETGPLNLSDIEYLRQMYEAGVKGYFDIASLNPYGLRSGPDDRRFSDTDTNFSRPIRAREIMVAYGDGDKPIWASETGWCPVPPDFPSPPVYGRVSLEQQARYTRRAYERVQREWPWLGMMALWHFRQVDNRLAAQQPYYFGIVEDDFTPKPVYETLRDLATAPPALYPGFRQHDHQAVQLLGNWQTVADDRAALGSHAVGGQAGDAVVVRFWGSDLDLVVATAPDAATVAVQVDGASVLANALPRDEAGRAVADLRSESETYQVRVPIARGLTEGFHTAEITVVGEGRFALDGFIVQSAGDASPLPLLGGLLLAGSVAAVVAVRRRRADAEVSQGQARDWSKVWPAAMKLGVLAATVAAFALRVHGLAAQSFWYDEGISVSLAGRGVFQIIRDAAADIHPPVYYLVLHFWAKLAGNGEFAMRFVSVAAGVLAVCLIYQLGKRLISPGAGVLAAILLAASPLAVYYGQEARMYSVLLVLTLAWSVVWLQLLRAEAEEAAPGLWLWWVGYAVLGLASVYTHYFAFFLFAFYNLWTLLANLHRRRFLLRWLGLQAIVVLSYVPWLLNMSFGQLASFQRDVERLTAGEVLLRMFDDFTLGHKAVVDEGSRLLFLGLAVLGIASAALSRGRRRGLALAALYLAVPAAAMLVLNAMRSAYQARLVMLALPGLLVVLAAGAEAAGRVAYRAAGRTAIAVVLGGAVALAALGAIVPATTASLDALYNAEEWRRDDYHGLVAHIDAKAGPADAIILDSPGQVDIFQLYYRGQQPYYPLPSQLPIDETRTEEELREIIAKHDGIWAVLWGTAGPDPRNFVERWLDAYAFKTTEAWFGGVRLAYYVVETVGEREPIDVTFGDGIHLHGYAWATREGRAGDVLPLTLHWEALREGLDRYKVFVHVLDEQEKIWGQRDSEPAGGARPTSDWRLGEQVEDRIGVPLDENVPPGTYQVELGLYDPETMERPPVYAADGSLLGNRVLVGPIEVKP